MKIFNPIRLLLLLELLLSASLSEAQVAPFYDAATNLYGYKDPKGSVVISPKYELAYSLNEGFAAFKQQGKYGYVDQNGKVVVAAKYDDTWKFIGGYAAVRLAGKYGFINVKGEEVAPLIYERGYNYHGACCYKGQAHVKENGKWKIITLGSLPKVH